MRKIWEIYACGANYAPEERCAHRRTCFWLISPKYGWPFRQKTCIFVNEITKFWQICNKKGGSFFKRQTLQSCPKLWKCTLLSIYAIYKKYFPNQLRIQIFIWFTSWRISISENIPYHPKTDLHYQVFWAL